MGKLRLREGKLFSGGHTASKELNPGLDSCLPDAKSMLFYKTYQNEVNAAICNAGSSGGNQ